MSDYNLNEIEIAIVAKNFTPIILNKKHQLNFKSAQDVRMYAKGPGNVAVHTMMDKMLEAFFGHYSTCVNVNSESLVTMFGKLFSGWVTRLVKHNVDHDDSRIYDRRAHFDQHYKHGNDDLKEVIIGQRMAFNAVHRTSQEIQVLVSKYVFKIASRYYNVPHYYHKDVQIKYLKLRVALIDEWYRHVDDNVIKSVFPDLLFKTISARDVAWTLFPQDKELYAEKLDERLDMFIKWHKTAARDALQLVHDTKDVDLIREKQNEWDSALLYAKKLHDGMKGTSNEICDTPMAEAVSEEEIEEFLRKRSFE